MSQAGSWAEVTNSMLQHVQLQCLKHVDHKQAMMASLTLASSAATSGSRVSPASAFTRPSSALVEADLLTFESWRLRFGTVLR